MKGRIKHGAPITQDHRFCRWPTCYPPMKEYEGEEYLHLAKDPDMVFEVEWHEHGGFWECEADGYGTLMGKGAYGNGSILVTGKDNVEIVEE